MKSYRFFEQQKIIETDKPKNLGDNNDEYIKGKLIDLLKIMKTKSHNLNDVRKECAQFDIFFNNTILEEFCSSYDTITNQVVRYGLGQYTQSF